MAALVLGVAGDRSWICHQPLLPPQPAPFLRAPQDQAYRFGVFYEGRTGMVSVRLLGISRKFGRSLHCHACGLHSFRSVGAKTFAPLTLLSALCDGFDDHDCALEANC